MTPSTKVRHPREKFDEWGWVLDLEDWGSYVVDDCGIAYVNDWYPFNRSVRLSPAHEYRSWRNEYLLLWPQNRHEAIAHARLTLRAQGMGVMTVGCTMTFDLRAHTFRLTPDDLTDPLRYQAEVKAARVLELLASERLRLRTPPFPPGPITAADLECQRRTSR